MKNEKAKTKRILPRSFIDAVLNSMNSVAALFIKLRLTPNSITVLAFLVGVGAGVFFYLGKPGWAIAAVVLCGLLDILDGKVAVQTQKASKFGAIFDSTMDRYSEFFIYLGIAMYFRGHWAVWLIFFTFLGSSMVSYTRARAEGLGFECRVGIMQRAERMVLIVLGTVIGVIFNVYDTALIVALGAIALISNITAIQRTFHVKKQENRSE